VYPTAFIIERAGAREGPSRSTLLFERKDFGFAIAGFRRFRIFSAPEARRAKPYILITATGWGKT
jgi:hypothetical protein